MARPWIWFIGLLLALPAPCGARQEYEVTIETSLGDTTETFWLQIPKHYAPGTPCPLLIGWHQWGGRRTEMRDATTFDDEADARRWIAAAMDGPSPTHWTNRAAQSHMVDVIRWIEAHYDVDPDRIYMVGASMGGAAGMIFSNSHLDPGGPMIAAAASLSGIQDCERRFHEQGTNESMIAAFGGTPEEVPFTYHRNSAVVFADSMGSMHVNARHLSLYLTFGSGTSDSIWRAHAEDLYAALEGVSDVVVLRESAQAGHGWACAEETRTCDFLAGFSLDRSPARISLNADGDGRWYWADLTMRDPVDSFARLEAGVDPPDARIELRMVRNLAAAALDLGAFGFPWTGRVACRWEILDAGDASLSFPGLPGPPAAVLRDGEAYDGWSYDPAAETLRIDGEGSALYTILFDPAAAGQAASPALRVWQAGPATIGYAGGPGVRVLWDLFDAAGRRVRRGDAGSGSIRLAGGLPTGVYVVRLRGAGRPTATATCRIILLH